MFFGVISIVALILIDYKMDPNVNNQLLDTEEYEIKLSFKESIINLNTIFWLLLILAIFFYGALLSFNYIATGFLIETYFSNLNKDEAETMAGLYMSIPFLIGAILIPFFGVLVDKLGKKTYFLLLGSSLGFLSFLTLYLTHPLVSLILLGFGYTAFATVVWPSVIAVVNKALVTFAFGLFSSIVNLFLFLFQFVVLLIYHKTVSYYMVNILFI